MKLGESYLFTGEKVHSFWESVAGFIGKK